MLIADRRPELKCGVGVADLGDAGCLFVTGAEIRRPRFRLCPAALSLPQPGQTNDLDGAANRPEFKES